MKKNILFTLTIIALIFSGIKIKAQQALSPNLFSQNGWMTDIVGGGTNPLDSNQCSGLKHGIGLPCYVYGQLYQRLGSVKASKVKFIRYGGTTADQNIPTFSQYRRFVDSVRAEGMEPILQIPVNLGNDGTQSYDTLKAKDIIREVNGSPYNRNVVYWSIGNEPDEPTPRGYGYDSVQNAPLIAKYIKDFSKAMRRAVPSVAIKIIGPEIASWNSDPGWTRKKMVDSLITSGSTSDITGKDPATNKPWIDIFSFHYYGGIDGDLPSKSRATLIAKLRSTYDLAPTLDYLNTKLAAANSAHNRTGSAALISALTEAHIDFQSITNDDFSDVKCNGFFAGQYWLEIASIAAEKGVNWVNYWSAAENSMGYMKDDGTKKSTYCHFQKIAENFSGTYYTGSDQNNSGVAIKNIKAFGTKDANQIAVIILNQDSLIANSKRVYSIRLNGSYPTTDTNRITLSMGIDRTYRDTIEAASTTMLIFDVSGNITQKYRYKQSSNNNPVCFIQPSYCSNSITYTLQSELESYSPGVYSNITITPASGITIDSKDNTIYQAVNTITINGDFTVPLGQTLSLLPTPCN